MEPTSPISTSTVLPQPDLPPDAIPDSIRVRIGEVFRDVPKTHLSELSRKFHVVLHGGMQEQAANSILLEMSEEIADSFLRYLDTGKVDLTGDNVCALLTAAQDNDVAGLAELCIDFLADNLDDENFHEILELAINLDNINLKWVCLSFVATVKLVKLSDKPSEEARRIVCWGKNYFLNFSTHPFLLLGERYLLVENASTLSDPSFLEFKEETDRTLPHEHLLVSNKYFSNLSAIFQWASNKLLEPRLNEERFLSLLTLPSSEIWLVKNHEDGSFNLNFESFRQGWYLSKEGLFVKTENIAPYEDEIINHIAELLGIKDYMNCTKSEHLTLSITKSKIERVTQLLFDDSL